MVHRTKRKLIISAVVLVLAGAGLFTVFRNQRVAAQWMVFDPSIFQQQLQEIIKEARKEAFKKAATAALENAAQKFLYRMAYETANYLSAGGPGGTSLNRRESFGRILERTGEAAVGDFVQDLSAISGDGKTSLNSMGLNICDPSLSLKLNFSLQLLDDRAPNISQKRCDVSKIVDNWKRVAQSADVGLRVSYGSSFDFGRANTNTGDYGKCEPPKNQKRGYCFKASDGSRAGGCDTDKDCTDAGLSGYSCIVTQSQCMQDSDCSTGWKCVGAKPASGAIPWLSLTANQTVEEKFDLFNQLASPEQSSLGAWLALQGRQQDLENAKKKVQELYLQGCPDTYDQPVGKVSAEYIKANCQELQQLKRKSEGPSTAEEVNRVFGTENSIWLKAAKIFGSTLISNMLQKYIKAGSFSLKELVKSPDLNQMREDIVQRLRSGSLSPLDFLTGVANNLSEAQRPALATIDQFDYLTAFTQCPQNRNQVELDNCTIDDEFAAAIREGLTVREALEAGQLRGDLPLISELNTSLNGDPFCLRTGYCESNIKRLRKYRIVPLGWEIAASLSPIDHPITLGEAVNCFDNTSTCRLKPEENVFYHLIDPEWVLKAPETQCKAMTYGPKLSDANTEERQQYCADPISCLKEDAQGNCIGGYGYCTQEKNVWRFAGTECQAQYASCNTYIRKRDSQAAAYLSNTVDTCTSDQAGCKWYSKSVENVGSVSNPRSAWNPNDRIYLNAKAVTCDEADGGCSEYVSLATPGVNLLPNGSFDYYTPAPDTIYTDATWLDDSKVDSFDGWFGNAAVYTTGRNAFVGGVGAKVTNPTAGGQGTLTTRAITGILADKTITLSWLAKSDAPASCQGEVSVHSASSALETSQVTYTNEWKLYEVTTSYPPTNSDTELIISFASGCVSGATTYAWYLDGVKLEINPTSSGFTEYAANGKVHLKAGDQCAKEDVGCDMYTPVQGGFGVPGKIDSQDLCPAECVGYQNYLETYSKFDQLDPKMQPLTSPRTPNLIAATATSCNATEVDCEEFTNLLEAQKGGESRRYYSYVRQCVDDPLGVTFYTLEGSDTAGYQVRTWRLLPTNLTTGTYAGQPCTHVDINAKNCTDTAVNVVATSCSAAELNSNLNCREFFDIDGNPHYVLQDKAIVATKDCVPLRRTSTGTVFYGLEAESRSCGAASNGCREYRGNQGGNTRTIFADTFESGRFEPWKEPSAQISSESVTSGGHSLTNNNPTLERTIDTKLGVHKAYYLDFWAKSNHTAAITVTPSLIINPSGAAQVHSFTAVTLPAKSGWQRYSVGPLQMDAYDEPQTAELRLQIGVATQAYFDNIGLRETMASVYLVKDSWKTPASCNEPTEGAMLGCQTYRSSTNQLYNLRSFSKLCSESVIGCQAFIDTHNSSDPFERTFNEGDRSEITVPQDSITYLVYKEENRCFAESKGCTQVGEPVFDLKLPEDHPKYISDYKVQYLINNPDTYSTTLCTHEGLFCEEYVNSSGSSVYFKDPRNRVCEYKENVNIEGTLYSGWFQKDSLSGGVRPVGCTDDGALPFTDTDFAIRNNAQFEYDGWVGMCPSEQDQCTEFKDPLSTEGANLAKDDEFSLVTTNPAADPWSVRTTGGNTLVNQAGNGGSSDAFEKNTAQHTGVTRAAPRGGTYITQTFTDLDESDVFAISADANIQAITTGSTAQVAAGLRCQWDSPSEQDYCQDAGGNRQISGGKYQNPCTTDADCRNVPTYNDSCRKYDAYYCDMIGSCTLSAASCRTDADCGAAGGTCAIPVKTSTPCTADGQCTAIHSANYFCNTTSTAASLPNRDQGVEYVANADLSQQNEWQNLYRVADLSGDSKGKNLLQCELQLFQTSSGSSEVFWKSASLKRAKNYYYINDNNVDTASCNGKVSKKEGCLLFLDTSQRSSRLYDSFATYELSSQNGGAAVSPVTCDGTNPNCHTDSNRIIKVKRDRECAQWLSCRSATEVYDSSTNSYRQVCDEIGICDQYASGKDVLNCSHWVPKSSQRLEYGYYLNRSVDVDAVDYSGFSIYNYYPVGTLELVDVSIVAQSNGEGSGPDTKDPKYRLVRVVDACSSEIEYGRQCGPRDPLDATGISRIGRCFAPDKCVVGIDGSPFDEKSDYVIPVGTRAWAEKDSPFPHSVVESESGAGERQVKFGFQSARICDSRFASCELRYYKFQYGTAGANIVRYYSADTGINLNTIPTCICQGGLRDGQECYATGKDGAPPTADDRCPDNGSPVYLRRTESFINWPGFCLEKDMRASINASSSEHACLTWYPVDNSPNGFDFYNQNRDAGYHYKTPAYYCLEFELQEYRKTDPAGCHCDAPTPPAGYNVTTCDINGDGDHYCGQCHVVHKKREYCFVPPNGDGWYPYNGNTVLKEQVPKPICKTLGKAVDEQGSNAARTNRFWTGYGNGTGYTIGDDRIVATKPALGYKLNQDDTPFGSAVPSGIGYVTEQLYIAGPKVAPRAGSPYACTNKPEICKLLDESAKKDGVSIEGWQKTPPYAGNENYVDGYNRLREIYGKVFGIYRWAAGTSCDFYVCGRSNDPDVSEDGRWSDPLEKSSYFGGQVCDPSQSNACNALADLVTCADTTDKCVNSVFNGTDPNSGLFQRCAVCPLSEFETETNPSKRCRSKATFADETSCRNNVFDPSVSRSSCGSSQLNGYSCGQDPDNSAVWRCYGPEHSGNDCKIPRAASGGGLNSQYLECKVGSSGTPTCFYIDGAGREDDTGVACSTTDDCAAPDDGIPDNGRGDLAAMNSSSFCSDRFTEGVHDFGMGQYCVGQPFTSSSNLVFDNLRVDCHGGANPAQASDGFGHTLTGSEICSSRGQCLPAYQVRDTDGKLYCTKYPDGYLPMCNPSVQSCTGVEPENIISNQITTLDYTSAEPANLSPLIVPVKCDTNGVNCWQSNAAGTKIKLDQFNVPASQGVNPNDNAFSVNNAIGNISLEGWQNYLVSLRFYMAADKEHIPVRYIEVDWGDGLRQTRTGYYKNNLQQCGEINSQGPVNGRTLEYAADPQACRTGFRNYLHVYGYSPTVGCGVCAANPSRECGRDSDCGIGGTCTITTNAASCYRPRVMIQDNWGWCTNAVYGEVGMGCKNTDINPKTPPGFDPYEPRTREAGYVTFPGVVKVYKDPKP